MPHNLWKIIFFYFFSFVFNLYNTGFDLNIKLEYFCVLKCSYYFKIIQFKKVKDTFLNKVFFTSRIINYLSIQINHFWKIIIKIPESLWVFIAIKILETTFLVSGTAIEFFFLLCNCFWYHLIFKLNYLIQDLKLILTFTLFIDFSGTIFEKAKKFKKILSGTNAKNLISIAVLETKNGVFQ